MTSIICTRFDIVAGSDSFHMMIFRPERSFFYASSVLCVCNDCCALEFEKCSNFDIYSPSVGKLSKKQLRSEPPKVASESEISVVEDTVFAIRADSVDSNYFLVMCDANEREHNDPENPLEDDLGHTIYDGTKYVTGRYLEYVSMNNKCHVYKVSRKKVYVISETIFFPFVPILATTKANVKIYNEVIL